MTGDLASESHLPADVAEAVHSIRQELGPDPDVNAVIVALRAKNIGFLQAIKGLRAIKNTPLGEAKWLVHQNPAYADTAEDRQEFWRAAYEVIVRETDSDHPAEQ